MSEPKLQSTRHLIGDERQSAFKKYRTVVLGGRGLGYFIKYELTPTLVELLKRIGIYPES